MYKCRPRCVARESGGIGKVSVLVGAYLSSKDSKIDFLMCVIMDRTLTKQELALKGHGKLPLQWTMEELSSSVTYIFRK